jgi:myo-inositol catabolism protein IolC
LLFACDHRDSFRALLRRVSGSAEHDEVVAAKRLLIDGFALAVAQGVPPGAAVLIDEQYGETLMPVVRNLGACVVIPVERSGQAELSLAYGDDFGDHVLAMSPDAVKVLLRWDPSGDNAAQGAVLLRVSQWMAEHHLPLIVEFLTPPEVESSERAGVMATAIAQILATGTRPDVWKVEGLDTTQECAIIAAALAAGSADARAIVLGRGVPMERAEAWLRAAAPLPTFVGFAIGKTLWQEPLVALLSGTQPTDVAVAEIARRYRHLVTAWFESR